MNTLYIVGGGVVTILLVVIAAYFVGRKGGADAVKKDEAEKDTRNAQVAGKVMAEHRDDDDTLDRLRRGGF